jgi:serine/threonine protein kinase
MSLKKNTFFRSISCQISNKKMQSELSSCIQECYDIVNKCSHLSLVPFESIVFTDEPLLDNRKLPSDNNTSFIMKARYNNKEQQSAEKSKEQTVAVKILDIFCSPTLQENTTTNIDVYRNALHEFVNELKVNSQKIDVIGSVTKLIGVVEIPRDYCESKLDGLQFPLALVFDWVSSLTLKSFLQEEGFSQSMHNKLTALIQLGESLEQLHTMNIVHGNLTCDNLLLGYVQDENEYFQFEIKLIDFGMSCIYTEEDIAQKIPHSYKTDKYTLYGQEFNDISIGNPIHYSSESEIFAFITIVYQLLLNVNLETNTMDDNLMIQKRMERELMHTIKKCQTLKNRPKISTIIQVLKNMKQSTDDAQSAVRRKKIEYLDYVVSQPEFKEIVDLVCLQEGKQVLMQSGTESDFADLNLVRITDSSELISKYSAEDFEQANRVQSIESEHYVELNIATTNQYARRSLNHHMVIIGCASSGKTCFMRRKMYLAATKTLELLQRKGGHSNEDIQIPIFFRLREFIQNGSIITVEDLINLKYPDYRQILLELYSIGSRQLLFLMDGLDETAHLKNTVLQEVVLKLMSEKPNIKIVMTTRETGFDENAYAFFKE